MSPCLIRGVDRKAITRPHSDMNILQGELRRRGITYSRLAEKLKQCGAHENERNLANKISRGSFTAAFFMMCMEAIDVRQVILEI
jgi:hypothetical protein